ncbi:MAG TPA: zf-HC2 domain-containing protein [Candidatus Krumholzibacterium sp.]|nr:zf-HC2 domain-containing protein [Candidatus Krumholzibacterium sp.]
MKCNRMETDGMRYLDHEMNADEIEEFDRHLSECAECRTTMDQLGRLDAFTGRMKIRDPVDTFWEGYWSSVFRRLERKSAWLMIIAGAFIVAVYALVMMFRNFGRITIGKVGLMVLIAGLVFLFISVLRERHHQSKSDRYNDVIR